MGVGVDDARADHEAGRVERLGGRLVDHAGVADGHDAAVAHADIGAPTRGSGAIDDEATGDEKVEHSGSHENLTVRQILDCPLATVATCAAGPGRRNSIQGDIA